MSHSISFLGLVSILVLDLNKIQPGVHKDYAGTVLSVKGGACLVRQCATMTISKLLVML